MYWCLKHNTLYATISRSVGALHTTNEMYCSLWMNTIITTSWCDNVKDILSLVDEKFECLLKRYLVNQDKLRVCLFQMCFDVLYLWSNSEVDYERCAFILLSKKSCDV